MKNKIDYTANLAWGVAIPVLGGIVGAYAHSVDICLIAWVITTIAIFKIAEAKKGRKIEIMWKVLLMGFFIGVSMTFFFLLGHSVFTK